MNRQFHVPSDPIVAERIRQALDAGPEERQKLDLPKPKPAELLARWKIAASAAHSPARQKAKLEAHRQAKMEQRWMLTSLRPERRRYDVADPEGGEE
jgi:hypothetical protein